MTIRRVFLLLSLTGPACLTADGATFEFRHIHVASTARDVAQHFPDARSDSAGEYYRFPKSAGEVAYIAIYPARKLIGFRPSTSCRVVFDQIFRSYDGPNMVQKHHEARTTIHRRVWISGKERMALRCYGRDGERFAERIEFYYYPDNGS